MTDPIGPGDMVECVERPLEWWKEETRPGEVYQVAKVGFIAGAVCGHGAMGGHKCSGHFIYLTNWPLLGKCALPFRPISRRKDFESFLDEIKRPMEPALSG